MFCLSLPLTDNLILCEKINIIFVFVDAICLGHDIIRRADMARISCYLNGKSAMESIMSSLNSSDGGWLTINYLCY